MGSTRKLTRRRIKILGDDAGPDSYVDVPCVDEVSVQDPKTNAQEYGYRFENTPDSTREVRIQRVYAATNDLGVNTNRYVDAERIKVLSVKDPKTNAQEYGFRLRNDDPPPTKSDGDDGGDKRHRKVQYIRYTKNGTSNRDQPWVDMEQIYELEVQDPKTFNWESVYRFVEPDFDSLEKVVDPTDPYATMFDLRLGICDSGLELKEFDGPVRLDPLQNIVNINAGESGGIIGESKLTTSGAWIAAGVLSEGSPAQWSMSPNIRDVTTLINVGPSGSNKCSVPYPVDTPLSGVDIGRARSASITIEGLVATVHVSGDGGSDTFITNFSGFTFQATPTELRTVYKITGYTLDFDPGIGTTLGYLGFSWAISIFLR